MMASTNSPATDFELTKIHKLTDEVSLVQGFTYKEVRLVQVDFMWGGHLEREKYFVGHVANFFRSYVYNIQYFDTEIAANQAFELKK